MQRLWAYLAILITISSCASYQATPSNGVLSGTFSMLGGPQFFNNLDSLQISVSGSTYASFMGFKPTDVKKTTDYEKTYSFQFDKGLIRTDALRNFVYEPSHGFHKQNYIVVTQGGVGAVSDGAMPLGLPGGQLPPQTVAAMDKMALLTHPHILLKEIIENKREIVFERQVSIQGEDFAVLKVMDDVSPIFMFIEKKTKLISKIETTESHLLMRDSRVVVEFSNWTRSNSSMFPLGVTVSTSGNLIRKEVVTSVNVNPQLNESYFDFPYSVDPNKFNATASRFGTESIHIHDEFFEIAGLFYGEGSTFNVTELAPNVYEFRDSTFSHLASMAVKIDEKLIVLEAITSPKSADQLISKIHEVFPDHSIDFLVQSHHHIDHSAGVRSFVATGAELVVGYGAANWWKQVLMRESALKPDSLEISPNSEINITETELGGFWKLKGTNLSLTAYHIHENSHAIDMLLTAIETEDQIVLYVADLYNAGFGFTMSYDGPVKLFRAMRNLELIDELCESPKNLVFLPSHGRKTTLANAITELTNMGKAIGCETQ